jgi:hypothetical protein
VRGCHLRRLPGRGACAAGATRPPPGRQPAPPGESLNLSLRLRVMSTCLVRSGRYAGPMGRSSRRAGTCPPQWVAFA